MEKKTAMTPTIDMTAEEFFNGLFNLDFMSEEEKQTIYKGAELFAKGKVKQIECCGAWVKADDVLAPDCMVVLACIDDEDEPITAYLSHEVGKWYRVHNSSKYIETPSHWMPLPNKPSI